MTDNTISGIPVNEPDRQFYFMNKCHELVRNKILNIGRSLTYCVTTFGCQMNSHDSEKLKGILDSIGYIETDSENADFVVFNTCTVRENANMKLYGHLGHLKNIKAANSDMIICLCGCMMQEAEVVENIKSKYKFVDIVFGTHNIYKLAELMYKKLSGEGTVVEVLSKSDDVVEELPEKRKYPFKSGLNIMYGCNNFCSYCIVPYVRGREKSRLPVDIIKEAEKLAADGVKEIMLLGQNVNSYGKVFDYSNNHIRQLEAESNEFVSFPELLRMVCRVEGIERVRFMTSHPKDLSDELIKVMSEEKKLCKHIHLPVQSGSTDILTKMNRRYTKEQYLLLVDKLRNAMPDISITTDIIVGFPGETEEDFLETLDVVEKVKYDQAYTFIYSKRTGTPAATMENQIMPEVIKDRFKRLLDKINEISNSQIKRYEGQIKRVLIEEINQQDSSLVTGRTNENITVHFPGNESQIGEFADVLLKECRGFYFMGERNQINE